MVLLWGSSCAVASVSTTMVKYRRFAWPHPFAIRADDTDSDNSEGDSGSDEHHEANSEGDSEIDEGMCVCVCGGDDRFIPRLGRFCT